MDARDGGSGGSEFAGKLRAKATEIEKLAIERHAEDINDYAEYGAGTRLPVEHEHVLYGTRTGNVIAVKVVPGTPEWAVLQRRYSWVPDAFEQWCRLPDPDDFQPLVTALDGTLKVFGAGGPNDEPRITDVAWGKINSTTGWIEDWYGDAATQFSEFADPFEHIGNNHAAIAEVLRRGAQASRNVAANTRDDVNQIADATVAALRGKSNLGGDDLAFALTVVGAVAGVLSAIPTMGASLQIGFSMLAATTSVAKDTLPDDGESKPEAIVGGHTVDAILTSMAQELSRLNHLLDEEERKIKSILERNLVEVTNPETRKWVEAPRPHLADMTTGPIRPHFTPPQ